MFRRISWAMLKPSITHAKSPDNNIKSRAPLIKSKSNGNRFKCKLNPTRKPIKSGQLRPFLQLYSNTWEHYPTKRQVYFSKTSKNRLKLGRITYRKYLKLFKC